MILEEVVKELESSTGVECRTLRESDVLAKDLHLSVISVDRDWVWVALKEGTVRSAIIASPCHGTVFIGRIVNSSHGDHLFVPLLRSFLSDITERGYKGIFTFLDNSPAEEKLRSILVRFGGTVLPGSHVCVGAALSKRKW